MQTLKVIAGSICFGFPVLAFIFWLTGCGSTGLEVECRRGWDAAPCNATCARNDSPPDSGSTVDLPPDVGIDAAVERPSVEDVGQEVALDSAVDASEHEVASGDDGPPTPDAGLRTPDVLDASSLADVRDVADVRDSSADRQDSAARDTAQDLAPPPTEPYVEILPASGCHGRRLGLSNDFAEYARLGLTVWHLCYETVAVGESESDSVFRPIRVRLHHLDLSQRRLIEDALVIAPRTGDSWTANLMLAASPGFPPFFNLALVRSDGLVRWAVDSTYGSTGLTLTGRVRLWRVAADGAQTAGSVTYLCRVEADASADRPAFWVPDTSCPRTSSADACGLPALATCRQAPR